MPSLMGSLYIGVSGLQTSQNALNTTAHNMSNADTTGYVRQQVQLGTGFYNTIAVNPKAVSNQQLGLGVYYSKVKQVRDYFLDQTYRRESGRSAFYEVSSGALEEVEYLLDELNGESFQESLEDLWRSVQELSKDPSSAVTQGLMVQRSAQFLERAQAVYAGLVDYQNNLNNQIQGKVDKINSYADQILALNKAIVKIESGKMEEANDLRDERNRILDELAAMVKMTYSEDMMGNVSVQVEGVDLVKGEIAYKMGLDQDEQTGFYTPFWIQNASYTINEKGEKVYNIEGAEVFDLNAVISSDLDTDIGSLKSMLLARGDHKADYRDLAEDKYDNSISQSVIMNIQAEFDQLIHNVCTAMNQVIKEAAEAATAKNPDSTYLRDSQGRPIQIFQKIGSDGYTRDPVTGDWTYNDEKADDYASTYSVANLQMNSELMQNPSMFGFITIDGSVDYETIEKLKTKFTEESNTLNPNVKKKTSFVDYYGDLVAQVANSGKVYKSIVFNQQATVNATFSAREQVIGVSSDEELTHMVKFQNAYNASSRYINAIDEMLAHIINTLAV
ncbi:MAG: flagellar hook-associated protein FlgK [Lachnospiraceae bacterium]|nr:flagellar hook-associated protein FlgK [Lachnospiraceae bacterium]MDY3222614.1 flagellar hook-associated protein FlgK [Lachnospiraceae bacterium]